LALVMVSRRSIDIISWSLHAKADDNAEFTTILTDLMDGLVG